MTSRIRCMWKEWSRESVSAGGKKRGGSSGKIDEVRLRIISQGVEKMARSSSRGLGRKPISDWEIKHSPLASKRKHLHP